MSFRWITIVINKTNEPNISHLSYEMKWKFIFMNPMNKLKLQEALSRKQ